MNNTFSNKDLPCLENTDSVLAFAIAEVGNGFVRLATNAIFETRKMANEVLDVIEKDFEDNRLSVIPVHYIYEDWNFES